MSGVCTCKKWPNPQRGLVAIISWWLEIIGPSLVIENQEVERGKKVFHCSYKIKKWKIEKELKMLIGSISKVGFEMFKKLNPKFNLRNFSKIEYNWQTSILTCYTCCLLQVWLFPDKNIPWLKGYFLNYQPFQIRLILREILSLRKWFSDFKL